MPGQDACRPFTSSIIFCNSRGNTTGLVSKSLHPASRASSRWPAMAWAVRAMTGVARVSTEDFSCRMASHPSTSGIRKSIRTTSGCDVCASRSASRPSAASTTSHPCRMRRRESISRFASLSSTSSTRYKTIHLKRKFNLPFTSGDHRGARWLTVCVSAKWPD